MIDIDTKIIGNITFYGLDKLTQMLGLSKATLRAYIKNGTLKGRKIGVKWYVCEDSVTSYLNETTTDSNLSTAKFLPYFPVNIDPNTDLIQSYVHNITQLQHFSEINDSDLKKNNQKSLPIIEALSESVKVHDDLIECAQWENWISTTGEMIYVSPFTEVVTGYSSAECIEDPNLLTSIIHPADRIDFIKGLAESVKSKKPLNFEYRLIAKDKEIKWIKHQSWRVFAKDGRFLGWQVRLTDITPIKLAESASKVTDLLLNALCDNLKLSVIIIDSNYTIKTVKGIALLDSVMLFGQAIDSGVNLLQISSKGNKDKVFSFVVKALNGTLINEELNCEFQGIQKKLRFSIYPIKPLQSVETRENALVCMVINETEITNFVVDLELDRQLKIYDNLPHMMYLLDEKDKIYYVNNKWCNLTGYEKHEVVGHSINLYIRDISNLSKEQKNPFFLENIEFKGVPGYLTKKDGNQISVFIEGYQEIDKNNKVWKVCLLREVSCYTQQFIDW